MKKKYHLFIYRKNSDSNIQHLVIEESSFYEAKIHVSVIMREHYQKDFEAVLFKEPIVHVWRDGFFTSDKMRFIIE